jgi:hypothetical protein
MKKIIFCSNDRKLPDEVLKQIKYGEPSNYLSPHKFKVRPTNNVSDFALNFFAKELEEAFKARGNSVVPIRYGFYSSTPERFSLQVRGEYEGFVRCKETIERIGSIPSGLFRRQTPVFRYTPVTAKIFGEVISANRSFTVPEKIIEVLLGKGYETSRILEYVPKVKHDVNVQERLQVDVDQGGSSHPLMDV